jgi:hypothetical protein
MQERSADETDHSLCLLARYVHISLIGTNECAACTVYATPSVRILYREQGRKGVAAYADGTGHGRQ